MGGGNLWDITLLPGGLQGVFGLLSNFCVGKVLKPVHSPDPPDAPDVETIYTNLDG